MQSKTSFDCKNYEKKIVKVKDHLYVSKYETSNSEFKEFLTELLKSNQASLYENCLPDTLCWKDTPHSNEPYTEYYFQHPSFGDYPVVGITYEAANEFCSWLTKEYNQAPKRKFKKVVFTLPSKEDWTFAANNGDTTKTYTWGKGLIHDSKKYDMCNYLAEGFSLDSSIKKNKKEKMISLKKFDYNNMYTTSVNSFFPNSFGIFNMCGNVAEMIAERGIAKGGSYLDPYNKVTISSEKNYTKPTSDIGFRIAMKIIEE